MKSTPVLSVASEIYPLIKTGGLADVAGALPGALKPHGFAMRTLVPGYPAVISALRRSTCVLTLENFFGGQTRLLDARAAGRDLFVLDAPHLYARTGGAYADAQNHDWPDNALRFAALARMAADLGQGCLEGYLPDVIHCHDWQAGLTAAYLHYDARRRPGVIMSVHNLAYQGNFDRGLLGALGLPPASFNPEGVEYYGDIGFLKAGLRLADRITTVSPTYAVEICTPEWGMGLDGLLRARADRLTGILNGIDTDVWDPARDQLIARPFGPDNLDARAVDKADLQARFGLQHDPDALLFAVISRLTWQKGLDLVLEAIPTILAQGGQLAVLGAGDRNLEAGFSDAAHAHAGRIGAVIGYDEALAHRIQAGADALLVPSRFEPCGLTQLCALRYGAVPVVSRVGGLNDTVIDAGPMALAAGVATGVQFAPVTLLMLENAIRQTANLFTDRPAWRRIQANGMAADVSWREPARRYARLYRDLITGRAG